MLDALQPGDLVLADRGFLISEQVQLLRLAEVKVPEFFKRKKAVRSCRYRKYPKTGQCTNSCGKDYRYIKAKIQNPT